MSNTFIHQRKKVSRSYSKKFVEISAKFTSRTKSTNSLELIAESDILEQILHNLITDLITKSGILELFLQISILELILFLKVFPFLILPLDQNLELIQFFSFQ